MYDLTLLCFLQGHESGEDFWEVLGLSAFPIIQSHHSF